MSTTVLLKNAVDSYVNESQPNKNFSNIDRMYVTDNALGDTKLTYIYFGLPSGLNKATIISARLRIRSGPTGWIGSSTINVHRLDGKFVATRITYNDKPPAGSLAATLTKNPAASQLWDFDVTSTIQQVANGQAWYGFRVASPNNRGYFWSAQAPDDRRPQLEITYTTEPFPPSVMRPSFGQVVATGKPILQFDFNDISGNTNMAGLQVRLYSSQALATANASGDVLDTGTVASSVPQLDLNDTAYGGLSDGSTVWWRVRVQDGAGLWSGWSPVGWFTRQNKGTLNVTNPASGGTPTVYDATPTITWTFTGQTQKQYETIITDPATPSKILWTSGVVTSTNLAVTPPPGVVNTPGKTYRLIHRVYDTQNRVAVPGDPTYVEVVRDFLLDQSVATAPVSNLTGAVDPFRPWYTLEWDRSGSIHTFVIIRDGVIIDEVQPLDVIVSGNHYKYIDRRAKPRVPHTWSVAVKYDAITSSGNPTVSATPKLVTTHIGDIYGGHEIFLFGMDRNADENVQALRAENSEVHYVMGQAPPVLITQALRGYEGTITGIVAQDLISGLSSTQQLANLEYFKDNPGIPAILAWVDKVIKVVLYNISDTPMPYADGKVDYMISASFFQTEF